MKTRRSAMSPQAFSAALVELGLSMRQWCRLTGMDPRRAERTLAGDDQAPVPHWVPALLAALSTPGAMDRARQFAESFIEGGDDESH